MSIGTVLIPEISEEQDVFCAARETFMSILSQLQDALTENVVSRSVYGFFKGGVPGNSSSGAETITTEVDRAISKAMRGLAKTGSPFIGIAGLSGALAVALGAYGAHVVYRNEEIEEQRKEIYDRTNNYHFIHSLALLGVPLCRRPVVTGSLLSVGTLVFCGTCYYRALTNDNRVRHLTPYGGMLMILGWLSMAL
ncbi:transmembrane protein 256 homolog [Galendromus occidentalis]|uniref:Transmembrane protein 256 homolog n=1 Tax=Galendromus occidentalis TaxID=34638 RepID=A0AAJ6VWB2_9ACAR|nr:transmembrane protein 256 homolog [Galendromus occidentalis]